MGDAFGMGCAVREERVEIFLVVSHECSLAPESHINLITCQIGSYQSSPTDVGDYAQIL